MHADTDRWHVMLVDAEPTMHRLVESSLQGEELRLTCVGDGARALRVLEQERVDLIVMALTLPVVDGVDLLRHVANRRLPLSVLVITGVEPPPLPPGSPLGFLREPFRGDDLVARVRERMHPDTPTAAPAICELAIVLAMERRSGALHVLGDGGQGVLLFTAGALVDAAVGELRGDAAARELLARRHGLLRIDTHVRAREFTVTRALPELLRQAAALPAPRAPAPAQIVERRAPAVRAVPAPPPEVPVWEQPGAPAAIDALLTSALALDGAVGAALAVWELAHELGIRTAPASLPAQDMRAAVSGDSRVVRATMTTMARLGLVSTVQDIAIVLDEQMHVLTPLARHDGLFLHLVLDRKRSNLALARLQTARLLGDFTLGAPSAGL